MTFLAWLRPGNDPELAATHYAGRESATDRNTRKADEKSAKRRASHHRRGARDADRHGAAWLSAQR